MLICTDYYYLLLINDSGSLQIMAYTQVDNFALQCANAHQYVFFACVYGFDFHKVIRTIENIVHAR